jgi:hypothetical protein
MAWKKESFSSNKNAWGIPKTRNRRGEDIEEFVIHEETVAVEDLNIFPQDLCLFPLEAQSGAEKWTKSSINLASEWEDEPFYPQFSKWQPRSNGFIQVLDFYPQPGKWTANEFYPQYARWAETPFYPQYAKWDPNFSGPGLSVSEFYPQSFKWTEEEFYPQTFIAWPDVEPGAFYPQPFKWTEEEFYPRFDKWRLGSFYG